MGKDICIALAFEPEHIKDWYRLFSDSIKRYHEYINLVPCECLHELIRCQPSIIVGHESSFLINYLKEKPLNLQWIQFMSTGLNKTLDAIGKNNLPFRISNIKGIHDAAMREYVFSVILYFEKELARWLAQRQDKLWLRKSMNLVENKTILITGTGSIGTSIAELARCFSMKSIGISRSGAPKSPFDRVSTLSNMNNELRSADYVVVAMPLTDKTLGAFGQKEFSAMKSGSIFVNISRGKLVDENALIDSLSSGHLAGAALDTFSEEPLKDTSPLWNLKNLLITPHVSGKFVGGRERGVQLFLENLDLFFNGGELKTEVFPERGY